MSLEELEKMVDILEQNAACEIGLNNLPENCCFGECSYREDIECTYREDDHCLYHNMFIGQVYTVIRNDRR